MERRRPESISLPPMRNIFNPNTLTDGNNTRGAGDVWCSTPSNTEFLSRHYLPSPDRVPRICGKHRPHTPPPSQRSGKTLHQYPSPFSDDHHAEDAEMAEARPYYLGTPSTPLFTNDEHSHIPSRRLSAVEMQRHPAPTTPKEVPLTPSIVHYRPEGVPAARSRRPSIQKSGNKKSNELKIRMSKWDRLTDKGTAPLKIEPRSATQRACTLCHFTRRKCERTDGARPSETHPCAACQKHSFVCQFIPASQLRESTAQAPSIESLKLLTDQAQRLRTQELEEQVVKLEYEMELARTELRVKNAYIDNLKVYEGIVNGYVLRLRERLEGFEPGCRLLEYRIPAMPAAGKSGKDESVETSKPTSDLEYVALSEIVDELPVAETMELDTPDRP